MASAPRFGSSAPGLEGQTELNDDKDSTEEELAGLRSISKRSKLNGRAVAGGPLALSSTQNYGASLELGLVKNMPAPSDGTGARIGSNFAQQVASHYNRGAGHGQGRRNESRIIRLRSFNNWIKAVLLNEALSTLKSRFAGGTDFHILDLACGKGGDIGKYDQLATQFNIKHVTFVDISADSIDDALNRYGIYKRSWTADFYVIDCAQDDFEKLAEFSKRRYHLVVCHFAVHYSFESFDRARVMLSNLCMPVHPHGVLILTTMDSLEIVRRLREVAARKATENKSAAEGPTTVPETNEAALHGLVASLTNSVFKLEPKFSLKDIPLFCATYDFHLDEVVNLPEFLVHPLLLKNMAARHFMLLDSSLSKPFTDLFERFSSVHHAPYRELLVRMEGLKRCVQQNFDGFVGGSQSLAAASGRNGEGRGSDDDDDDAGMSVSRKDADDVKTFREQFRHAYTYFTQRATPQLAENDNLDGSSSSTSATSAKADSDKGESVGTLSKDEWEMISLYRSFVFNKHGASEKVEQQQKREQRQPEPHAEEELTPRQQTLKKLGIAHIRLC